MHYCCDQFILDDDLKLHQAVLVTNLRYFIDFIVDFITDFRVIKLHCGERFSFNCLSSFFREFILYYVTFFNLFIYIYGFLFELLIFTE